MEGKIPKFQIRQDPRQPSFVEWTTTIANLLHPCDLIYDFRILRRLLCALSWELVCYWQRFYFVRLDRVLMLSQDSLTDPQAASLMQ